MTKFINFFTRIIAAIAIGLCLLYLMGLSIFNCALSHDIKNELGGMLTLTEFRSLEQNGMYSSSFSFIRNGEDWGAFGVADVIHGPDVYICKQGTCG